MELTYSQVFKIFQNLEKEFGLYAEEKVVTGDYRLYRPRRYIVSKGKDAVLDEIEEKEKIEEVIRKYYRRLSSLDRVIY